ncbi:multicopper oxidase [Actinomadura sp. NBRC 104425]|uniref:multicopper oxidase domain-containing protein n=1 Tax=Actinomadura sp. NBRC 104425 TaxID=3032204 RepID=UPI0024A44614|nr:multicopper oxidase domain-containing protein [Actinomadura sp. NBRC 104425]GLZ15736.1 multicopper oxidase [Actinomadura sp. NBRC 104425]
MTSVDDKIERPRPRPPYHTGSRATWHAIANAVVLAWFAVTVITAFARDRLPGADWVPVHTFLLGAVTNAIVTWTEHFSTALLHLPPPARWWQVLRLAVLNAGVVAVLHGSSGGDAILGTAGAVLVCGVAAIHVGTLIARSRRSLGGRFAHLVAWYMCSGAALVAGGTLGALMVSGQVTGSLRLRVEAAHIHANLLGWVGLSVLGTLFILWPAVLRTRAHEDTGKLARRSLVPAVTGLAVTVGALVTGTRWAAAAGLALYGAGTALALTPSVRTFRRRRPHSAASWMLTAATGWFVAAVAADLVMVAVHPADEVAGVVDPLLPLVMAGFVGQILVGSMMFLLPVVLGGGPAAVKRNSALLEYGWKTRLILANAALPLTVLPVPTWLSRAAWGVLLAALAAFVVLAAVAVARSFGLVPKPPVAGLAVGAVLTAVVVVIAVSGRGGGTSGTDATEHTGHAGQMAAGTATQTVNVTLQGMRVRPGTIEAAPGTRLVLRVTNVDTQEHDLRLDTGQRTPMLRTGETAALRLDPLRDPVDGWCTVPGHRAAGMTLRITPTGTATASTGSASSQTSPAPLDLTASPSRGWRPYDAALKPAPGGREHRVEIRVEEKDLEVAPGVRQRMWTFNGTVPGPTLRGSVGDVFTVTFVNAGTMGHGIDFHAGALAPDRPMRTIQPGERLTYRFRADQAGAWLYHCSTMPMTEHMANGMYGAVVIDPPDLPRVDREYILVQGELYTGQIGDTARSARLRRGDADAWMFNGTAAGYDHAPLTARTGERVRFWVVAAGPSSGTAFHIIGTRFDTVYKEGAYLLRPGRGRGGAQVLDLAAAQGGFIETAFPEPGRYSFVDHNMRHGEAGAHGYIQVTSKETE